MKVLLITIENLPEIKNLLGFDTQFHAKYSYCHFSEMLVQ